VRGPGKQKQEAANSAWPHDLVPPRDQTPCERRQSEIHISEDWGNWRGASTGDGRVVMWAKLDFATLRVGKGWKEDDREG